LVVAYKFWSAPSCSFSDDRTTDVIGVGGEGEEDCTTDNGKAGQWHSRATERAESFLCRGVPRYSVISTLSKIFVFSTKLRGRA